MSSSRRSRAASQPQPLRPSAPSSSSTTTRTTAVLAARKAPPRPQHPPPPPPPSSSTSAATTTTTSTMQAAPPTIVRKKRNFRDLQLNVAQSGQPNPEPELIPSRLAAPAAPVAAASSQSASISRAALPPQAPLPTQAPPPPPPGTAGRAKRKPPAMDLTSSKSPSQGRVVAQPQASKDSPNILTVTASPHSAPATGSVSAQRATYHSTLTERIAGMELANDAKIEIRAEDLKEIGELGQGNGGSVKKVEHIPTGKIMAKKIVFIDAKPSVRKQILRELQILYSCHSEYIISFHGAFVQDPNVCICIEFMDRGSLDNIYKRVGAIPIEIVAKIAVAVLEGLTYLYEVHHIVHRDIKPSNILLNSQGQIKICDFGVSGELINSIADTFVGTSTYMSPERIQGAQYTVKSDVWSLGISLIELALGRFPFSDASSDDSDLSDLEGTLVSPHRPSALASLNGSNSGEHNNGNGNGGSNGNGSGHDTLNVPNKRQSQSAAMKARAEKRKSKGVSLQGGGMMMSILELLQHIVNEPAPRLTPEGRFPKEAEVFVDACLLKDVDARPTPKELMSYPWIVQSRATSVDLEAWAKSTKAT